MFKMFFALLNFSELFLTGEFFTIVDNIDVFKNI